MFETMSELTANPESRIPNPDMLRSLKPSSGLENMQMFGTLRAVPVRNRDYPREEKRTGEGGDAGCSWMPKCEHKRKVPRSGRLWAAVVDKGLFPPSKARFLACLCSL